MTEDLLATPWGRAPLLDLDVPALLPTQRTSPRPAAGPWGDRALPVPVPSWSLRERQSEQLRERQSEQLRERRSEQLRERRSADPEGGVD